jgi:hypothetical protein
MKTSRLLLLLILPCFLLSMTCRKKERDNCHYEIRMHNDSDIPIYAAISYDYPDTGLNFQRPISNYMRTWVEPHKVEDIRDETDCIESKMYYNGADKLLLFVFDARLTDTVPWPQIRQNYQILKRYEYTLEELKAFNFELVYP